MKPASTPDAAAPGAAVDPFAPTSELPFAARHCDVAYLARVDDSRLRFADKLATQRGDDLAPEVVFARSVAGFTNRVDQVGALLATIDDYLKSAHRGGSPDGASATAQFLHALALLGLARELVEGVVPEAVESLQAFCSEV